MGNKTVLHICKTCNFTGTDAEKDGIRGGHRLLVNASRLLATNPDWQDRVDIRAMNCLSSCKRSCAVAVSQSDKFTYVIGDLDPNAGAEDILAYAAAFNETDDGQVPWRARPVSVRKGCIARIPPALMTGDPVETEWDDIPDHGEQTSS